MDLTNSLLVIELAHSIQIMEAPLYFVISVHSIRIHDCSIRVVEQNSVYKSIGFSYPSNFTYLNTIGKQRRLDN